MGLAVAGSGQMLGHRGGKAMVSGRRFTLERGKRCRTTGLHLNLTLATMMTTSLRHSETVPWRGAWRAGSGGSERSALTGLPIDVGAGASLQRRRSDGRRRACGAR